MIALFLSAITQFVFGLISIMIVLRIMMKMLGASTVAPFVAWLYETTEPLLSPFQGVFPTPQVTGGFVLEISALVALVVYGLAGFLINTLVTTMTRQPTTTVHEEPRDRERFKHYRN
jgi:uncharacterized protein YggT (Ycf19 family)